MAENRKSFYDFRKSSSSDSSEYLDSDEIKKNKTYRKYLDSKPRLITPYSESQSEFSLTI